MLKNPLLITAISVLILVSFTAPSSSLSTSARSCIQASTQSNTSQDGSVKVTSSAGQNICTNPIQANGDSQYDAFKGGNTYSGYTPVGFCGNFYNFQGVANWAYGYQTNGNTCYGFVSENFAWNTLYTVNYPTVYGQSISVTTYAYSSYSVTCDACSTAAVTAYS